jgi:hypothetical protein
MLSVAGYENCFSRVPAKIQDKPGRGNGCANDVDFALRALPGVFDAVPLLFHAGDERFAVLHAMGPDDRAERLQGEKGLSVLQCGAVTRTWGGFASPSFATSSASVSGTYCRVPEVKSRSAPGASAKFEVKFSPVAPPRLRGFAAGLNHGRKIAHCALGRDVSGMNASRPEKMKSRRRSF